MVRQAEMKSYENRVIFHRMADTIGYMEIENVIVSCGTCYEMLESYELDTIFPDAELIDINEYIVKNKLYAAELPKHRRLIYHDPCHSPLKLYGFEKTIASVTGVQPELFPYCCGEGGTLALSTPVLSNSLRERKARRIAPMLTRKNQILLTTCPSCMQGLSKLKSRVSVTVKPLNVFLADCCLGPGWKRKFLRDIKKGGYEHVLF
jgi:Fe-S oxidoreductase